MECPTYLFNWSQFIVSVSEDNIEIICLQSFTEVSYLLGNSFMTSTDHVDLFSGFTGTTILPYF